MPLFNKVQAKGLNEGGLASSRWPREPYSIGWLQSAQLELLAPLGEDVGEEPLSLLVLDRKLGLH